MKRITIRVPEELAEAVTHVASLRRLTVAEFVRRALEARLGWDDPRPRPPGFANLGHGGHTETARRIEEILGKEWVSAQRDPQ
jgi:predicted transcriptional regulator